VVAEHPSGRDAAVESRRPRFGGAGGIRRLQSTLLGAMWPSDSEGFASADPEELVVAECPCRGVKWPSDSEGFASADPEELMAAECPQGA
jgi:hypothetical protein